MGPLIRVLPPDVANRIAAGEVVERPASVVKELIENALDAGARDLALDLEEGGVRLVRLRDDGSGMGAEDLARCVLPHATSKIASVEDLFRVASFGFRGEALPSIASVSELTILTRPEGEPLGHRLRVDGGNAAPVEPAGAPPGTTVEVRNLFWNVPARKKFLKQERTELGQCLETVTRLLLPEPEVAIRVTHHGRKVLETAADADLRARVRTFYGEDLARQLLDVEERDEALSVTALAGPPSLVKGTARLQHFFLNGRSIRDRGLAAAVAQAYHGLIMPKDHPVVFLFLDVDPAEVDVNVHPTKAEVRFRSRDRVFSRVHGALRRALAGAPAGRPFAFREAAGETASTARDAPTRKGIVEAIERELFPAGLAAAPPPAAAAAPAAFELPAAPAPPAASPVRIRRAGSHPGPALDPHAGGAILQVHRSYLVQASPEGLRIFDQHALHERKLYEELLARFRGAAAEDQHLLVPEVLDLAPAELGLLLDFAPELAGLGLEVEAFGPASACVRSVPAVLAASDPGELVREVLDVLREEKGRLGREDLVHEALAGIACKAAVRFHHALSPAEAAALLAWSDSHPECRNCPHGRPTSITISLRELEAQFQRKR